MGKTSQIRVLMTKIGLDGHDRGIRLVCQALRNAGLEVIYTGPWQTPEEVAEIALQEDVDIIGISSLAYDHVLTPKLISALKERNLDNTPVVLGGIIPDQDVKMLKECGVAGIFHPGVELDEVVAFISSTAIKYRKREG